MERLRDGGMIRYEGSNYVDAEVTDAGREVSDHIREGGPRVAASVDSTGEVSPDDPGILDLDDLGGRVQGELTAANPFRLYRFTVHESATFEIETSPVDRLDVDTVVELFEVRDAELLTEPIEIDDDSGVENYSRIEIDLEPGQYILRVRGFLGDIGSYQLRVET